MTTTTPLVSCGAHEAALIDTLFPRFGKARAAHELICHVGERDILYACYALGRMSGQAEKVSLHACRAFMIRPAPVWLKWALQAMQLIAADHYGLTVLEHGPLGELWGVHPDWAPLCTTALALPYPSPQAHQLRGRLCGIPLDAIDHDYHLRQGTGAHSEPGTEGERDA